MTRIPAAKRGGIFKRMETDVEYANRLRSNGHAVPPSFAGDMLDAFGESRRILRRIVESSAD